MVLLIGFQTPLNQSFEEDVKQEIDYKANYFPHLLQTHSLLTLWIFIWRLRLYLVLKLPSQSSTSHLYLFSPGG